MINKKSIFAIIGTSRNTEKYGYKVFNDLLSAGYKAIPINPKNGKLLGRKVWRSVLDYKQKIDVAIFVTPPVVTAEVLPEIKAKNIKQIWFQPGSESEEAVKFCQKNNIEYTQNACIMIERKK